jgi:outer membrane protein assembly factor BamB
MTAALRSVLLVLLLSSPVLGADWPGWRGPTGQGTCPEKDLPLTWDADGKSVLWKVPLPGTRDGARPDHNQSSPILSRGRLFLTASWWPVGVQTSDYPEHHVLCYQAADGKLLWDVTVRHGPWKLEDLRGGYTAPTPAADGERVYVVFGSSVIAALDLGGKELWRKEIVPFNFDVAMASSPVLFRDTVILQCDQVKGTSVLLAFDRTTGEVRWRQKRPEAGFCHSTPVLAEIKGRPQLLTAASDALQGIDPTSGKLLWWCQGQGDTVSPVLGDGIVYLDSGRGSSAVGVDPIGMGDVSKTHLRWKLNAVPAGFSSPVVFGGILYRLQSPETLRCRKMATGEEVSSQRLAGVNVRVSPFVTPEGRIYAASAGKSYVLKAGPKPEVLAVNDLGDPSDASPAVSSGRIFLRGGKYLYCIGTKQP